MGVLGTGVHVNANTLSELSKIAAVVERLQHSGRLPASALGPVGLRINPLVGAGEIEALRSHIPCICNTKRFTLSIWFE